MNKSRYKKSGRIRMRKKENQKFSRKRREKLKKDENRQPESKTAMITFDFFNGKKLCIRRKNR